MKIHQRIAATVLVLVMLLSLAACGAKDEDGDTPNDEIGDVAATYAPTPVPTPTEKPEPTPSPTPEPTPEPTPVPTPVVTPEPPVEPSAEPSEVPVEPVEGVDLSAFFDTISSNYEFGSMMDMDSEMLNAFYPGLTSVAAKQLIAKMPMITANASEIVLIECESESDVTTVRSIFETRKQSQMDGGAWYPETIEQWGSAQICVNGNYVMLVCHQNAADIAASFNALFA